MDFINELNVLDCPVCGGAGALCEEGGWAFSVQCMDCGTQTAPAEYTSPEGRRAAAEAAVNCWNLGKVVYTGPGD